MRKICFLLFTLTSVIANAQLTVEKIMRDPKWMGTQPSNISWSWDGKQIFLAGTLIKTFQIQPMPIL